MATIVNRKADFFTKRIDSHNESNRELECSSGGECRGRDAECVEGVRNGDGVSNSQPTRGFVGAL